MKNLIPIAAIQIGDTIHISNDLQVPTTGRVIAKTQLGDFTALVCTDPREPQTHTCTSAKGFIQITSLERDQISVPPANS